MTDTSDSFVQEVSEELRKDQIMGYIRRFGWIVVLVVVGSVGATAYFEYQNSNERAAAEATGEALLSALNEDDVDARIVALNELATSGGSSSSLAQFLNAQELLGNDRKDEALAMLDQIATNSEIEPIYRDLGALKAVMIRGATVDAAQRHSSLDSLAEPGRPFRVSALEQKAIVFIDEGKADDAINLLNDLLLEPNVSQAQTARWQQVIVALGGEANTPVALGSGDQ